MSPYKRHPVGRNSGSVIRHSTTLILHRNSLTTTCTLYPAQGRNMDLLITDVTEMDGGHYCIAGWDAAAKRMVRPLPNGKNWAAAMVVQYGIVPGTLISVTRRGASNGIFPHQSEDTPIDATSIKAEKGVFSDWLGDSAPQVAADLNAGFGGHLQWNSVWQGVRQGVHILPRVKCGSLVAIRVPKSNLSFAEPFGKLKATVNDGADSYQLTVSSKVLKEARRTGGLAAVRNALPKRETFHVRIGLARPFQNPPKCYAMLNGVL